MPTGLPSLPLLPILACLPLFWPILAAYGLVTLLPLLPCSLTYPGCPWPIIWLPAGLSLATLGLALALVLPCTLYTWGSAP